MSNQYPKYHPIGYVAKLLGLPDYTIRYWESEFKQLNPRKSRTGRRVYGEDDIVLLKKIQRLVHDEGFTIKGAKEKLEEELSSTKPIMPEVDDELDAKPHKSEREVYLEQKLHRMRDYIKQLIQIMDKPNR